MNSIASLGQKTGFNLLVVESREGIFEKAIASIESLDRYRILKCNLNDFSNQTVSDAEELDIVIVLLDLIDQSTHSSVKNLSLFFPDSPVVILLPQTKVEVLQKQFESGQALCLPIEMVNSDALISLLETIVIRDREYKKHRNMNRDYYTPDLISNSNQMVSKISQDNRELQMAEFIASMSYDLKSPLHGILSFSEFGISKMEQLDKEKLLDYMGKIHNCGKRVLSLIGDLVDFCELKSGIAKFEYRMVSLSEIVRIAINENSQAQADKNITINFSSPEFDDGVEIDPQKILQVLTNLISNAIKFSESGETVSIYIENQENQLQVRVVDRGVGLGLSKPENFFETYILPDRSKPNEVSTGLVLAICKYIVTGHGGTIRAEENPDKGLQIIIDLPKKSNILISADSSDSES